MRIDQIDIQPQVQEFSARIGVLQMKGTTNVALFLDIIVAIRDRDETAILGVLERSVSLPREHQQALLRMAIQFETASGMYFRRVANFWRSVGGGVLKPSAVKVSVELLSDGTIDGLVDPLTLFLAAYGIDAAISKGEYDSLEFEAIAGVPGDADATFVITSERWARQRVSHPSPTLDDAHAAVENWTEVLRGLASKRTRVIVSDFIRSAWPVPSAANPGGGRLSWNVFLERMNAAVLSASAPANVYGMSGLTAQYMSGGAKSSGRSSLVRMRAPLEPDGLVALAREMASGLAHLLGRGHRALLLDWDNTLWGGEVAEVGHSGIEVGPESPDAYAYQLLQSYILDLNLGGTLLAAISRNDPAVAKVLDLNEHLLLRRTNFASLQLSWGDKSDSAGRIVEELNFAPEFMVYVDDNHVDLAQVLDRYPSMDVVLAGPEPDLTLNRLAGARFFNAFRVTAADTDRAQQANALREQREAMQYTGSREDFLRSLEIEIGVEDVSESNMDRVLQLLQKTNQFNVTTKRHDTDALDSLRAAGAEFGVFDYTDRYGSQGIIGLIILVPSEPGSLHIDTWLMSCRVLNRGVEEAMLSWMKSRLQSGTLYGSYLPTKKNGLVADLFDRLGFSRTKGQDATYSLNI